MYLYVFILLTTSLLAALWLVLNNNKKFQLPTKEEQELIDSFYINRK